MKIYDPVMANYKIAIVGAVLTSIFCVFLCTAEVTVSSEFPFEFCSNQPKCDCYSNSNGTKLTADCKNRTLKFIPKFRVNVTVVLMGSNPLDVGDLPLFEYFPTNLNSLDLSDSGLQYHLEYFSKTKIFSNLVNLRTLNLKRNNYLQLELHSYPIALTEMENLETLRIDGIKNAKFPPEFRKLKNLTSLDLSGILDCGICRITRLNKDFFSNLPHLIYLNLSGCEIRHIELGTFKILNQLHQVNLSHNEQLTFRNIPTLLEDISSTSVEILDVSKIHCTYGVGTMLYISDVVYLNVTNLTHLYLDSNRLSLAEEFVMYQLPPTLTYMSAKDNRFTMGTYILQFEGARGLKEFVGDLSFSTHNPTKVTNRFRNCKDWRAPPKPNLRRNGLSQLFWDKYTIDKDKTFSERKCNEKGLELILNLPRNMETLRFSKCGLSYAIPCLHFNPNNSLRYADLSQNIFSEWTGPLLNLRQLEYLDLNSVYCSNISGVFFQDMKSLKKLIIHNNLLGLQEIHNQTFEPLIELRFLNASRNKITSLPRTIFNNNVKLECLDLSFNFLNDLNFNMDKLKNLKYLDLSNNRISFLEESVRNRIEENDQLRVNLLGNRLQCACGTLPFLTWILKNNKQFLHFRKYTCRFSNDTVADFKKIQTIIGVLRMECFNYGSLIIGVVVAIGSSLLVILCGLGYRYRWRIRYLYYMARSRREGKPRTWVNMERQYTYDALISYAEADATMAKGMMHQILEIENEFKLCFHERDFTPGKGIAENITEAIHNSRKMLIILSPSYVKSKWCMHEFNMGRMENMYGRRGETNFMTVILYKNVPSEDIPLDLMNMIKNEAYIEYREEGFEDMFWNRVISVLER